VTTQALYALLRISQPNIAVDTPVLPVGAAAQFVPTQPPGNRVANHAAGGIPGTRDVPVAVRPGRPKQNGGVQCQATVRVASRSGGGTRASMFCGPLAALASTCAALAVWGRCFVHHVRVSSGGQLVERCTVGIQTMPEVVVPLRRTVYEVVVEAGKTQCEVTVRQGARVVMIVSQVTRVVYAMVVGVGTGVARAVSLTVVMVVRGGLELDCGGAGRSEVGWKLAVMVGGVARPRAARLRALRRRVGNFIAVAV
jgi:hypothetical protein